jgi:hypothetical protein
MLKICGVRVTRAVRIAKRGTGHEINVFIEFYKVFIPNKCRPPVHRLISQPICSCDSRFDVPTRPKDKFTKTNSHEPPTHFCTSWLLNARRRAESYPFLSKPPLGYIPLPTALQILK